VGRTGYGSCTGSSCFGGGPATTALSSSFAAAILSVHTLVASARRLPLLMCLRVPLPLLARARPRARGVHYRPRFELQEGAISQTNRNLILS
jgi:hypothetical protein